MRAKPFRQHRLSQHRTSKKKLRAIGAFVPEITKRAFQKYGFSAATILTDWPDIIGNDLAAVTQPERLKWPRKPEIAKENDETIRRQGATLVIRTEPSRALDVQYQCSAIKDRINAYFGYCAVFEIRLLQAPLTDTLTRDTLAHRVKHPPKRPIALNPATDTSPPHYRNAAKEAAPADRLGRALACLEQNILGEANG